MIHLVNLSHLSLFKRLQLEEALLRTDSRNFCLYSSGADPAIVMGLSAREEEVIDKAFLHTQPIPLIRRFSGGGTVVVGPGTDFVTFIISEARFPKEILHWCLEWLKRALPKASLSENDYVIGERKFGGNAQAIVKGRFLQHTSLLWDFTEEEMRYLKYPPKTPEYRKGRSHSEFLTKLSTECRSRNSLFEVLQSHFSTLSISEDEMDDIMSRPHRKALAIRGEEPVLSTRFV